MSHAFLRGGGDFKIERNALEMETSKPRSAGRQLEEATRL